MKSFIRKANSFIKDLLLVSRIGILFKPVRFVFKFIHNFSLLSSWVNKHSKNVPFSDFYKPTRSDANRVKFHKHVIKSQGLGRKPIHYLGFAVARNTSFVWWARANH